jgi:hypothetical protein
MEMIEETRINYICDYCHKRYVMKHAAEWHEKHCTKNPANNHLCYQGCKHFQTERNCDGSSTYICKKKNVYMYGCGAERRRHARVIEEADIRMPTKCDDYGLNEPNIDGIINGGLGSFLDL